MGIPYSKLDSETVDLLSQHTHFDRKEIYSWYDNFTKQYPTGSINKEKMSNTFLRYYPFGNPKPYVDLMFRLFNTKLPDSIDFQVIGD